MRNEEFLTTSEAAAKLKIHIMTIYKWVKVGHIKVRYLPSGQLRIEAGEIKKLLSKQKGK